MKNKKKVAELINSLKSEIESPYELAAIERLEKELIDGAPKVEIIDENHQKFNGHIFTKTKSNHYRRTENLHVSIFEYYYNLIVSSGFIIHHIDFNPNNNEIDNLELLSIAEHISYHYSKSNNRNYICKNCGKEFKDKSRGKHCFCSKKCLNEWYIKKHGVEKICPICGKTFKVPPNSPIQCCTKSCARILYHRQNWQRYNEIRKCLFCGKEFSAKKKSKKKFCSNSCAAKYRYQKN